MLSAATAAAGTVGFQRVTVPDSDGTPREVGIWYPSDGPVDGRALPLVLILHGVQGSFANHHHTALALAGAGFVAAAVTQSDEIRLIERPRHVVRVLDYVLSTWPHRDRIDAARIGMFGFSVGGFTTLVTIGGVPDFGRIPAYCAEFPDRVCAMLKERNVETSVPASAWMHDARVKAAVVAAPTLAFTFGREALAPIKVPVQLWRAGADAITPHPRAAEAIYQALPDRPDYVVVPHAGHFVFVTCGPEMAKRAPAICQDAPELDRAAFHRELNAAVVAFFKAKLPSP